MRGQSLRTTIAPAMRPMPPVAAGMIGGRPATSDQTAPPKPATVNRRENVAPAYPAAVTMSVHILLPQLVFVLCLFLITLKHLINMRINGVKP